MKLCLPRILLSRRSPLDKHCFIENSMKINCPICYRGLVVVPVPSFCLANLCCFYWISSSSQTYGMVEQQSKIVESQRLGTIKVSLVSRQQNNEQQWAGHLSGFWIFVDHYPFVESDRFLS